jgi:hypothetical protein
MTNDSLRLLAREGVQSVKQKNVVQPIAWFCAVISVPAFGLATRTDPPLCWLLLGIGSVPVALFLFAYLWFMFTDASRLQSEEYQLKNRVLDIIESKGGHIDVEPANIQLVLNPASDRDRPRLSDAEGGT